MATKKTNPFLLSILLATACAPTPNPWRTDAIVTGNPHYDSSRLIYDAPKAHLKLEFLKTAEEIALYLFLDQHRFTPNSTNSTDLLFIIGDTSFKESIYLREGRMRLKLSPELTQRMILALQEGKQVTMMTRELQENIEPGFFGEAFAKFLKGSEPLNFIKGPFE